MTNWHTWLGWLYLITPLPYAFPQPSESGPIVQNLMLLANESSFLLLADDASMLIISGET